MKKLFSALMISLFLLLISQQGLILLHFKVNQEAIEKEFCVNKDKPKLECHGKCHLNLELQKTNKGLESTIIFKNIDLIFSPSVTFAVKTIKNSKSRKIVIPKEKNPRQPHLEILVPPPLLG